VQRAWGWGQLGFQKVKTLGLSSSNSFQQTYAGCTVTVYVSGTLTLATIFADNISTPLANPFTADATGFWFFYAANGRYDVSLTGGGIVSPITYSDILLQDVGTGGAITSINGLTPTSQTLAAGSAGSDFNIVSATATHTFNIPTASAAKRGLLSSADWTTFNSKGANLSAAAPITLAANVIGLTIPLTISQGGTGQTTAATAFSALSPLSTKGDVLVSNGSSSIRLPVGTNGQVMMADSTAGAGVKWATDPFASLTDPLTVAHGGTGLTAGTSGGIPYYSAAAAITSSALLAAGAPILGGGAGAAPTTSGVATVYNGQTLAGNGLTAVVFNSQVQTNQTSSHTDQILLTAPAAGVYRIAYYLFTGSVSDGTATAQITVKWTDSVGAKVSTPKAALALAAAANQTDTFLVQVASGNLTYTSTYAAGAGGNYNLLVVIERL
jgi:hypothetical protein